MKTICITLGDPNGLGPELVCRHYLEKPHEGEMGVLLLGPEKALEHHLELLGGAKFHTRLEEASQVEGKEPGIYLYEPPEFKDMHFDYGQPVIEGGRAAGVSLNLAADLLLAETVHGLLTCPLNKAMLQKAGFDFPGHTEFLAERLGPGRDKVCMHLGGPRLKVSLVTTHPPLKDVPGLITEERILRCLELTCGFMQKLGLEKPIAVCGLNPHAGESGRIGREEVLTIIPAIEEAKRRGLNVEGPFPADTVFHFAAQGMYSAVLAMYHDQGLAPLKLLHFSQAVNVTLGLPYPRTSPDHGTGYDLVGKGKASLESFRAALDMLERMV